MNPLSIPPGIVLAASFNGAAFLEFNQVIEVGVVEVSDQTIRGIGFYVQDLYLAYVGDSDFPDTPESSRRAVHGTP